MTRSVEIPEAAVEAAARAMRPELFSDERGFRQMESLRQMVRDAARTSLLAALPYLVPVGDENACHYSTEEIAAKIADRVPHADMDGFTLSERLRIGKAIAPLFQELLPAAAPAGDDGLREALVELKRYCSGYVDGGGSEDEQLAYDDIHIQLSQILQKHPAAPAVPQPAMARRHCTCEVGMGTYPGDHHERGCQLNPVEVSDDDVEVAAQQADEWREGLPAPIGSAVPQPAGVGEAIASAIEDAADERADAAGMPAEGYYAAAKIAREFAAPLDRQTLAAFLLDTVQTLDKDEEWYLADRILARLRPAQPVDREALKQAIAKSVGNWGKPAEDATDAVLAVLAGEQERVEP